jgi:hypothetical protein
MGCLILSVFGLLVGLFFFIAGVDEVSGAVAQTNGFNTGFNFIVGITLIGICGMYLVSRIIKRTKEQQTMSVASQQQELTPTPQKRSTRRQLFVPKPLPDEQDTRSPNQPGER